MRSKRLALVAAGAGVALVMTACGANQADPGAGGEQDAQGSGEGVKVGVILPETATSARWEGFDKPLLEKAMREKGLDPDIQNAQGDVQKFSTLADGMMAKGVKVLVIAAINSEVGSAVAKKAQARGIPTIDYDRLNLGGASEYYVSFDNVKVGELQGQGMADALKDEKGGEVIMIEGAPTDNNATLFTEGQMNVLKPLYDDKTLELVRKQPIDNWDNQKGGKVFEQILSGNGGKVDGVVAANDGLAGAVINVLRKNGLNGKVPVTGQDATPDGLMNVLRGDQYMTVFKPILEEAKAAAELAALLAKGDTAGADKLADDITDDPKGERKVKSVLLEPVSITKDSVKEVVDAGFVEADDICGGKLKSVCEELEIS